VLARRSLTASQRIQKQTNLLSEPFLAEKRENKGVAIFQVIEIQKNFNHPNLDWTNLLPPAAYSAPPSTIDLAGSLTIPLLPASVPAASSPASMSGGAEGSQEYKSTSPTMAVAAVSRLGATTVKASKWRTF
jgi:hypothetical protein